MHGLPDRRDHAPATRQSVITDAVNKLAAGGNTNLPAGLGWAWRVLTTGAPFEHTITTEYTPDKAIVAIAVSGRIEWPPTMIPRRSAGTASLPGLPGAR